MPTFYNSNILNAFPQSQTQLEKRKILIFEKENDYKIRDNLGL